MCSREAGAVVHAVAREIVQARQPQTSVRDAAGDHHRPRAHVADIADVRPETAAVTGETFNFPRHEETGTEDPGLLVSALSQLCAAEPSRRTRDSCGSVNWPRLAADGFPFHHQVRTPSEAA